MPKSTSHRFIIPLTVLNFLILIWSPFRASSAPAPEIPSVLRAHALEIVDDQGRVRAMIRVFPADPNVVMPDGTKGYPESVLLRLIDSKGGPNVKITATDDGSGMSLGGASNPTHIQALARGGSTSFKLINKDGREHLIQPGEQV